MVAAAALTGIGKPPSMACVQARYPRRPAYDRPRHAPCPTSTLDRPSPGPTAACPSAAGKAAPLLRRPLPQGVGDHDRCRRLHKPGELLAVLQEPTAEMRSLREMLNQDGRFPSRRTFERRLRALPETLPERIGLLGRHLVELLQPWARSGRAIALDSTVLRARGGVWHKKDKEAGVVPHSSIDTEAGWTNSGWHGWVYGWKLHLACTVAEVWIPLSAHLTPANASDGPVAPMLIEELPHQARFVLGETHYNAPNVREACLGKGMFLVASGEGEDPIRTPTRAWRSGASCTGCATWP